MENLIAEFVGALSAPDTIGLLVVAIILVPVFTLIVISIVEPPRNLKIPLLFLSSMALLTVIIIAAFAALSNLLGFVIT